MYFLCVPNQNKNTSIIFIDIEYLIANQELLDDFKSHIKSLHMTCFNSEIESLGRGLFVFATSQYVEINTKEDLLQYILIDLPENISSMAILYQNGTDAQLWSVCSTIEGQTRKLAKLIIQECQTILEKIELFVDYFNPYWERAISLYTSLGFKSPNDVLYDGREMMMLTWDKYDINEDLPDTIIECNNLKFDTSITKGFNVSLLRFSNDNLNIFKQILEKNREYGGGLGVKVQEYLSENYLNSVFNLDSLSSFYIGNYIIRQNEITTITANNMLYSFHTHPVNATQINRLAISCPSTVDLVLVLKMFKTKSYKHFVFEPDGIWTIQVHPQSMENAMTINPSTYQTIYSKYAQIARLLENDLDKDVPSLKLYKNTLINNYLANINNVTWKSLNLANDNFPILLLNFYPWSFVKSQVDMTGYWTDWTVYKPLAGLPTLQGLDDLKFNFDFDKFDPILEAIEYVGKLNVGNDETMMNTFINENPREDMWFQKDLLSFIKRYNDSRLIERIYNGEIIEN
jgi:hypothetical protein